MLVAQFHGNAENLSTHFVSLAWLVDHSYDLVTFSYSGYGKSTGDPDPITLRKDALSFFDHTLQVFKSGNYQKLIIYGQSLGGAVVMDALKKWQNKNEIDLLVLDSTFTSYKSMVDEVLRKNAFTWIFSFFVPIFFTDKTAPGENLSHLNMPKLIIHSENDPVVSIDNGVNLFRILDEKKTFWQYEDPGHVAVFFIANKDYRQKFVNFVNDL